MKHYKTKDNKVYAIEPEHVDMLPEGCVEISDQEAEILRAAPPEKIDSHNAKKELAGFEKEAVLLLLDIVGGIATGKDKAAISVLQGKIADAKARIKP